MHIYIDADACPVKNETYRVAARYQLPVILVANSRMRIPDDRNITLKLVSHGLDVADDWIAEKAEPGDIVITSDIPLAGRCLEVGARALGPSGKPFTEDNIGDSLATRELLAELRSGGEHTGGPPPLEKRDRSRFLHQLDQIVREVRRESSASSS